MRTNLIQSYMNNKPQISQNDRNLDIDYVLSNRTFIKPLSPEGHLVENNFWDLPANSVKSLVYDFKSLKNSVQGRSNDHELGKINDLGMKAGGLAIAIYLMTRKQTPLTKAMEFVGLASFFGAMYLWPKIALQLPAKLLHGFDIRQEYQDSFGRRKMFFQDPQYIPWDMVSDKEIDKIGNWMRVPKDIPNRRDFIQEKMKKTAVQNNTLWMLTAGFATPITSALICNACEKPLNSYLDKYRSKKADRLIKDFNDIFGKYKDKSYIVQLEKLYSQNADKVLTPALVNEINEAMTYNFDGVTASAIRQDLSKLMELGEKKYVIDDKVVGNLIQNITKTLEPLLSKEQISTIVPDAENMTKLIADRMFGDKSGFGNELSEFEVQKVTEKIGKALKDNLNAYNASSQTPVKNSKLIFAKLFNQKQSEGPVSRAMHSNCRTVFNSKIMSSLRKIATGLTDFRAKNAVLDEYIYLKAGAAPETVVANAWNEVNGNLPKLLNITDREITDIRLDRKLTGNLIRKKIEIICSNDAEYKRITSELTAMLSGLDGKINMYNTVPNSQNSYVSLVNSVFGSSAAEMSSNNMHNTAKRLVGSIDGNINGSLKNVQLQYGENRLLGVKSSLYRLLNTLDFYRRISTKTNIDALHGRIPLEVKEEIVEFCKKLSLEGCTSDFITKFSELRNPNPNLTDYSQIEVKGGKVVNKYLGQAVKGGKVDLTNDMTFFQQVMKLLYVDEIHPDTAKPSSILDDFSNYRKAFAYEVGTAYYFDRPFHRLGTGDATNYRIFLRVGMSPEQMLHSTIKEIFNTRKWLKTYGGIGAGLLGVTLLSQFFFGKTKNPERVKNDKSD